MTANELKVAYQAKLDRCPQENIVGIHYVTDTNICNKYLQDIVEIPLETCAKVINFYNEAKDYIRSLKVGDFASESAYGSESKCEIIRINKTKKVEGIFTFTIKVIFENGNTYQSTIKPVDIVYKGKRFYDIREAYYHASGYFISFGKFDKEHILEIAEIA